MARQWLTTAPNPRSSAKGFDAGQRGWRLHSVIAADTETFDQVKGRLSACGLRPRHGWSLDMFIKDRCKHCERALLERGLS